MFVLNLTPAAWPGYWSGSRMNAYDVSGLESLVYHSSDLTKRQSNMAHSKFHFSFRTALR